MTERRRGELSSQSSSNLQSSSNSAGTNDAPNQGAPSDGASGAPSDGASGALDDKAPDVVLVHGVEPDGRGLRVLRYRNQRLEAGAVRALEQGKPIQGEVVRLAPRPDFPLVCDVKVELDASTPAPREVPQVKKGPAQVATDTYRTNWDRIWKRNCDQPN